MNMNSQKDKIILKYLFDKYLNDVQEKENLKCILLEVNTVCYNNLKNHIGNLYPDDNEITSMCSFIISNKTLNPIFSKEELLEITDELIDKVYNTFKREYNV